MLAALGLLAGFLIAPGCAKRVPLEGGDFHAEQNVVLTMKDGREVRGHLEPGRRVSYAFEGAVYRARVVGVSKDDIKLNDIVLIDRPDSYQTISDRISDARVRTQTPLDAVTLSRTDIGKVELVRLDAGKTLRRAAFWAYGSAIFVLFLSQRS